MTGRMVALLASIGVAGGCAFGPGESFGEVDGVLGGVIESRGRIAADGRLETVGSYQVLLHRVEVEVASVRLIASGVGGGSGSFDPTSPPPGWLCHGGHCHNPEGELISYDEAAAILAGGSSGPVTFVGFPVDSSLDLLAGDDEVLLDLCVMSCLVGMGEVGLVSLDLERIRIEGEVRDLLAENRLGFGSVPLLMDLAAGDASIVTRLEEPLIFDRGHAPLVSLDFTFLLHPSILDGVPLGDLVIDGEIRLELSREEGFAQPGASLVLENLEASRVVTEARRSSR